MVAAPAAKVTTMELVVVGDETIDVVTPVGAPERIPRLTAPAKLVRVMVIVVLWPAPPA